MAIDWRPLLAALAAPLCMLLLPALLPTASSDVDLRVGLALLLPCTLALQLSHPSAPRKLDGRRPSLRLAAQGFAVGAPALYLSLLLFGAPLFELVERTALLASVLACLAAMPLACVLPQSPPHFTLFVELSPETRREAMALYPAVGALLGAWRARRSPHQAHTRALSIAATHTHLVHTARAAHTWWSTLARGPPRHAQARTRALLVAAQAPRPPSSRARQERERQCGIDRNADVALLVTAQAQSASVVSIQLQGA